MTINTELAISKKIITQDNLVYRPSDWKRTAKKITITVFRSFLKTLTFISNFIIPPIGLAKLYNYYYNLPLNEGINGRQLEAYSTAMHGNPFPPMHKAMSSITGRVKIQINEADWIKGESLTHIPEKKVNSFFARFKKILTKIARGESDKNINAESIRHSINHLVQSTVFQTLKTTTKEPAIQMLKSLSFAGTTADVTTVVQTYGDKVKATQPSGKQTINKLASDIDEINWNPWCFSRNYPLQKLWWVITHPSTTWHSIVSSIWPKEYNSDYSNPIFQAHAIRIPGKPEKTTPLTFGPTPTQPIYFDAHLPHLKENNKCEVRVILQDTKGSEGKRVAEFYKRTEAFREDGTLALLTLPFDMKPMKDPSSLMDKNFTIDSFMLNYAKFILTMDGPQNAATNIDHITVHPDACRNENFTDQKVVRPIIPENILNDTDLKNCFSTAKSIFNTILENVDLNQKTPEAKKQIATTMQLVTQALLIFAALGKIANGTKEIASLCIHCKQCVDRAVVLIIAMIMLDYIPTAKEASLEADLPENLVNLIHGIVVGRPELVGRRLGLTKRVRVLSDFLHVFGDANFANLKSTLSNLNNPRLSELIQCIQSNSSYEEIKSKFFELDRKDQCRIFAKIYDESGTLSEDPRWGEHHVFDDMDRFCHVVTNLLS